MRKAHITVLLVCALLGSYQSFQAAARRTAQEKRRNARETTTGATITPMRSPETHAISDESIAQRLARIATSQIQITQDYQATEKSLSEFQEGLQTKKRELSDLSDLFRSPTYHSEATQRAMTDVRNDIKIFEKDIARMQRKLSQRKRTIGRLAEERKYLEGKLRELGQPIPELPEPDQVAKKKKITTKVANILKTPEVIACQKFGFCSDTAKWLIRAAGAAAVAGATVYAGKKATEIRPDFQPSDPVIAQETPVILLNAKNIPQEQSNPNNIILQTTQKYADNPSILDTFFTAIPHIDYKNMRWGEFSLLGMLLAKFSQATSKQEIENISESIQLLKDTFKVQPTSTDQARWLYERSMIAQSKRKLISNTIETLNTVFETNQHDTVSDHSQTDFDPIVDYPLYDPQKEFDEYYPQ